MLSTNVSVYKHTFALHQDSTGEVSVAFLLPEANQYLGASHEFSKWKVGASSTGDFYCYLQQNHEPRAEGKVTGAGTELQDNPV